MKRISDMMPLRGAARDLVRDRNGNAAIEMALLAMPLFLFVFAIINAGRVMWLQNAPRIPPLRKRRGAPR